MTLDEIRLGIIGLLREHTDVAYITGEDIERTEEETILHLQLIPLSSKAVAAGHFYEKEILADISYMEQLVTSNRAIYHMLELLDGIFKPYFQIGDRYFSPAAQMDVTDDIGHYKMLLKFTDSIPFEEEAVAEKIRIDWRREDGIT